MTGWVLIAGVGAVFAATGLVGLFRRYRRGETSGLYLAAATVGVFSLVAYALASALRPDGASDLVPLALLLPALASIVVVIREHGRARRV